MARNRLIRVARTLWVRPQQRNHNSFGRLALESEVQRQKPVPIPVPRMFWVRPQKAQYHNLGLLEVCKCGEPVWTEGALPAPRACTNRDTLEV